MPKDQIPRMCDLLAPAVDALLGDLTGTKRQTREQFANAGRYGDILRGWRGQAELYRARLTKEVIARRRTLASGDPLKDLAKSEYFAELPDAPQAAVGEVTLQRTVTNASALGTGNFLPGSIASGCKIKRAAAPAAVVPTLDAEFSTVETATLGADDSLAPVSNGDGTYLHTQTVGIAIEATREGPHANLPVYFNGLSPLTATVSTTLFDKFTVPAMSAAGGSVGVVDDQIKAIALAMATGSYGPTAGAAGAGVLSNPSARRAVYVKDSVNAIGRIFAADGSWASSVRYRQVLLDSLRTKPWIGWGCRVSVEPVTNYGIVVAPQVLLRSRDYDSAQLDITANVKKVLLQYFNERPDWYTWTLNAIGAVIAGSDARILACTSVAVRFQETRIIIAAVDEAGVVTGAEPPASVLPGAAVIHYSLVGEAVDATYTVPS